MPLRCGHVCHVAPAKSATTRISNSPHPGKEECHAETQSKPPRTMDSLTSCCAFPSLALAWHRDFHQIEPPNGTQGPYFRSQWGCWLLPRLALLILPLVCVLSQAMYFQLPCPPDFLTCTCLLLREVQTLRPNAVDRHNVLWPWYRLLQHSPPLSSGAATDWRGPLLASLARSLPRRQIESATDRPESARTQCQRHPKRQHARRSAQPPGASLQLHRGCPQRMRRSQNTASENLR